MNRPIQLDIDGRESRAPVLPAAFLETWKALEVLHKIPRTNPKCLASTVKLDAAGNEVPAEVVHFAVEVGGKRFNFLRPKHLVGAAAREVWAKSGRPL